MNIGFTGTRQGMTRQQASQLQYVLALFDGGCRTADVVPNIHYGTHATVDLLADEEAASLAMALGYRGVPHLAAVGEELARNRRIVANADILVAAPRVDKEELRSGTWATVRYAREKGIPVVMLSRGNG